MHISLEWLKELVDLKGIQPTYLAERLTMAGFEVENINYNDLDDAILDISTTTNRVDTLSMVGIAREVSAILNRPLLTSISIRPLHVNHKNVLPECNRELYYLYSIVNDINICQSPPWLQQRIINNNFIPGNILEDIQHFIYLKWAQDINFFDLDKTYLTNGNLKTESELDNYNFINKQNQSNIKIDSESNTIDHKKITCEEIFTGSHEIATSHTTNLLVQASNFTIDHTSNKLQNFNLQNSNSSLDQNILNITDILHAYSECIFLIKYLCHGSDREIYYLSQNKYIYPLIKLPTQYITNILGTYHITYNKKQEKNCLSNLSTQILRKLRFLVWIYSEYILVHTPIARTKDITRSIDLIEEVSRIHGFDKFTGHIPRWQHSGKKRQQYNKIIHLRSILRVSGLNEVIHSSLVEKSFQEPGIYNPIIQEYNSIRSNLLINIIKTQLYNYYQGNSPAEVFEVGKSFAYVNKQYKESVHVAGIIGKNQSIRSKWQDSLKGLSWFEAKGIMEEILERLNLCVVWQPLDTSFALYTNLANYFCPRRTATIYHHNRPIGIFGSLNIQNLKRPLLVGHRYGFEIILDNICYQPNSIKYFYSYSKYPAVTRDITVKVPNHISFQQIIDKISNEQDSLIESIKLLNFYSSHIGNNKLKRLGFRITYRSLSETLTSHIIDRLETKLKKNINEQFFSKSIE